MLNVGSLANLVYFILLGSLLGLDKLPLNNLSTLIIEHSLASMLFLATLSPGSLVVAQHVPLSTSYLEMQT